MITSSLDQHPGEDFVPYPFFDDDDDDDDDSQGEDVGLDIGPAIGI